MNFEPIFIRDLVVKSIKCLIFKLFQDISVKFLIKVICYHNSYFVVNYQYLNSIVVYNKLCKYI